MTTSDLYIKKQDCCGCEMCSISCPKQIIEMREDEEGFLYPQIINETECINCKRCLNVCPSKTAGRPSHKVVSSLGGYIIDINSVKDSASGGFATAISKAFVSDGGVVYGVRYSEDFKSIEYARAETTEELTCFRTSKYAQAHKDDVYREVQNDVKTGKRVLFIGLPCEVSALYHYVKNADNLFTISLICHGPTSQKVHRQFCDDITRQKGGDRLTFFSMRYKKDGWKPYYLLARFNNGAEFIQEFNKTEYDIAFKYLKRPSCSVCRYKLNDEEFGIIADLVLGDYHTVNKKSPQYNKWGVSQASCITEKGLALMNLIKKDATMLPISHDEISTTNIALRASVPLKNGHDLFAKVFVEKGLHAAATCPSIQSEINKAKTIKTIKRFLVRIRQKFFK